MPDPQFVAYRQSQATALQCLNCIFSYMHRAGWPSRVLDVGCGSGHVCRALDALGISAVGLDLHITAGDLMWPGSKLIQWDLTDPWPWEDIDPMSQEFDLVVCLEVAEHLPERSADDFCDELVKAMASGSDLLFSAATPGQGGAGHLNEKTHGYWKDKLERRGVVFDKEFTKILRGDWSKLAKQAWWYGKNLQVFREE